MPAHADMTRPVPSASTRSTRLLAVALGGLVLAGCASTSSSTPPPPAASTPVPTSSPGLSSQLCSAAAEYQKAANALVNLDATKVGTDGVKAALQNLTASLALELADLQIRVNGVAPGFVQTPMMSSVPVDDKLLNQVPMKRFAQPAEIADAVAFLVSSRASYITGTSLDVNGGWLTC